jgi:hypothetical protein
MDLAQENPQPPPTLEVLHAEMRIRDVHHSSLLYYANLLLLPAND